MEKGEANAQIILPLLLYNAPTTKIIMGNNTININFNHVIIEFNLVDYFMNRFSIYVWFINI